MPNLIKVSAVKDFENIRYKCIKFMTKTIAVFKEKDGSFYAIEADCKHQNANLLSRGLKGDIVVCPRHGWKYNMKTGECLTEKWGGLRKYNLHIKEGIIFVDPQLSEKEEDDDDFFI